MAHQADSKVIETVVQLLCENGLPHMADAMQLMLNEAMRIERSQALEAALVSAHREAAGVRQWLQAKDGGGPFGRAGLGSASGAGRSRVLSFGSRARSAERAGVETLSPKCSCRAYRLVK
jgi:hypothetical protein